MSHPFLVLLYCLLPPLSLGADWLRRRTQRFPTGRWLLTLQVAVFFGLVVVWLNSKLFGGRILLREALLAIYLAFAALCLLRWVDLLSLRLAFAAVRVRQGDNGRPLPATRFRGVLALLIQRLFLLALVMPYLLAMLVIYRPRPGLPPTPPASAIPFEQASFTSSDGIDLHGWWFPATAAPDRDFPEWGEQTVLICHGLGSNKRHQLELTRSLLDEGYNVLVFDFRAAGLSGGRLVSFGHREREDVLAAVRWIKTHHPEESQRLVGLGIATGAAALSAAAIDPAGGQNLDALIFYEPYARFDTLARALIRRTLPSGLRQLMHTLGLPLISLHVGADLMDFAPAQFAPGLWPRPVLVVHGQGQTFIPVQEEMTFFQNASYPKEEFWPSALHRSPRASEDQQTLFRQVLREMLGLGDSLGRDKGVQYRTLHFLRAARRLPII